jgi:anti-sigma B factor antagonist
MNITTREQDGITIVDLAGRLDTNTAPHAEEALSAILETGASKLLLNFEKLDFVSSAGLRIVLATAKKMKSTKGELQMCALNEIVAEVFEISGFAMLFKIHATADDALAAF